MELRSFGKQVGRQDDAALVSHGLHRRRESGCGKRMDCVNSESGGAWGKGLEKTGDPQWRGF